MEKAIAVVVKDGWVFWRGYPEEGHDRCWTDKQESNVDEEESMNEPIQNLKRMDDIDKVRMTQQPYLTANNTHFRGSTSEYPLVTTDRSGRTLLHPNYSLRVNDIRLGDFIQKNIR